MNATSSPAGPVSRVSLRRTARRLSTRATCAIGAIGAMRVTAALTAVAAATVVLASGGGRAAAGFMATSSTPGSASPDGTTPDTTPDTTPESGAALFLGDDLIVWVLLALGGALFVGNVMALVRPPEAPRQEGDLERAPRGRSIFMASVGFVVAVSALAALIS